MSQAMCCAKRTKLWHLQIELDTAFVSMDSVHSAPPAPQLPSNLPPRQSTRRWRRSIVWSVLVIIGVLVTLYVLRAQLLAEPLARLAAAQLSKSLRADVAIERIDGNISWPFMHFRKGTGNADYRPQELLPKSKN